MAENYITIKQFQERFRLVSYDSALRIVRRYQDILKPIKVGRRILIQIGNLHLFERDMRVFAPDED